MIINIDYLCHGNERSLPLSVSFGAVDIAFITVWEAVFHFNSDLTQHQIIKELRLHDLISGRFKFAKALKRLSFLLA